MKEQLWYIVQTRSRFEKKSCNILLKKGISVYLPLQTKIKVWSDRLKKVEEPLFSGYLFVKYDDSVKYEILNVPGVVRFVSFGGKYATISDRYINAIKRAIAVDEDLEIVDLNYEPGQEVKVVSGPFKDNYAKVIRGVNGRGKLLLELEAIGKAIVLEIGRTRIEPVIALNVL
jgi:transcription termination/antitermination protein NusG